MTVQIVAGRRADRGKAARRIFGRCALAVVIGVSIGAISSRAFGADLAIGSSRSITAPPRMTRADPRPMAAQLSNPSDTKLDHLAAHTRVVNQLYEELMRWSPPRCASPSSDASMAGRC